MSCICENIDDYPDVFDWLYTYTEQPVPMPKTVRARRCYSCRKKLEPEEPVMAIYRWRSPRTEVEEKIHGNEVPLAIKYMCSHCRDIFMKILEKDSSINIRLPCRMDDVFREYQKYQLAKKIPLI